MKRQTMVRWGKENKAIFELNDHLIPRMPFPIGGPWNQASISNGFRDIQRRM